MYCSKCGNKIDKGSTFCGKCGKATNNETNSNSKSSKLSILKRKQIIIPCIIVIIIALVYGIVFNIGKSNLSNELIRDWSRVETGDNGTLYKVELDFSKDKIDYNFISSYAFLNSTLTTFEYKVVSPSKIKIKDKTYKIEFNEDKTMMTITPALTSTDDSEDWYYHK